MDLTNFMVVIYVKKIKKENGDGSISYQYRKGRKYYTGRYTVGFNADGSQVRRSVSGYNKGEVQEEIKQKTLQVSQGLISTKNDVSFGTYYKNWIYIFIKPNVTPGTFEKYDADYRLRILRSPLENVKLSKISPLLVRKTINYWLENFSLNITEQCFGRVKTCLKNAIADRIIIYNPTINIKIKKEKVKKEKYKHFTVEQQDQVLGELNIDGYTPKDMLIYMYFSSGCRLSEGLALTWDDFHDGGIDINKQYAKHQAISNDGEKRKIVQGVTTLKTFNSYRFVPLPEKAIEKIENYRRFQKMYIQDRSGYVDNNLMFPNASGGYLDRKIPRDRLKSICTKFGYSDLTIHSIRHTYATRLFENGVSPKVVQSLLGHKSIDITMNIYTHVVSSKVETDVNKLNFYL